jgi:hypothetical protein
VKYELGFYIPEEGILHSHHHENLKYYIALTGLGSVAGRDVSPVRHDLGFYIPEDGILLICPRFPVSSSTFVCKCFH